MSPDELKSAIISYLDGYSIEATPHDEKNFDSFPETLPAGASVYMANLPGVPLDEIVRLTLRLKDLGFNPVPHIVSRKLESREQLERALEALANGGVREALVLGGDSAVQNAAFDSSLEVLETGLFGQYGFTSVGVAGHPEGSKAIGEQRVAQALQGKNEFAKTSDLNVRIVTQFSFNPDAVTSWERETTEAGIELPIHAGFAGPASVRQLVKFAMLCGIGTSARMAVSRSGATANLLRSQAPDDMITHIARHRASHPESRFEKAHFFCFGGVVKTAKWANSVVSGDFDMNRDATGFEVR
ncbi:MAG: methylenetetrahydrofolate reductase [Gammaproteobacteria bacterium]|nr:methylenetetrahydrofolate reductase [Gammaproteobacteria bacterium]